MNTYTIGMTSLNIAFVLYLFLFLPQIWHNRRLEHIQNLSPSMHLVLYFGVLLDLFYGFASDFQWQYKTVSIVSLAVLSIQHLQLIRLTYQKQTQWPQLTLYILITLSMFYSIDYFFTSLNHTLSALSILVVGYASRVCYQLYTLPQIIKNIRLRDANAISPHFLMINITLLVLDTISGWCLDWGWPAKLSPPISLVMMFILIIQRKRFVVAV